MVCPGTAALAAQRPVGGGQALNEVLVDTDVVSYLLNRHSLAGVYEQLLAGREPMISFMTVAGMYRGALKRNWGPRSLPRMP
jgi:hypothetical protein